MAAAVADADVVVLAVPDRLIDGIAAEVVPLLKSGAMVMTLDPAAAYAGVLTVREDITYFVTHPCHPPLFNGDTDPLKVNDWFGGVYASQHVVCALFHGPEADYAMGEALSIDMFGNDYGPVLGAHRITVAQMAMLEPALVETFAATLVSAIYEMRDHVIARVCPGRRRMPSSPGISARFSASSPGQPVFRSPTARSWRSRTPRRAFSSRPGRKTSWIRRTSRRSVAEITGSLVAPR